MDTFNVETFLKEGTMSNFNESTTESNIVALLGVPDEIEEYGNRTKYLHYKGLRFSIFENYLNGVTVFFYDYKIILEGEVIHINENTPLISFLDLLNKLSLKWQIPYENSKLDYLSIITSKGVNIYYYFENGKLIKMNRLW